MKNSNVFVATAISILLSACNSSNSVNNDDTKKSPVLDGTSSVIEASLDCSQDENYIYGTSQGCNFSFEKLELGESQKLKCVGEDVYVNDILMSNPQIGSLNFTCQ